MDVQTVIPCSFNSGATYYRFDKSTVTRATETVQQVYATPPFPRDKVRVLIDGDDEVTRLMTDKVNSVDLINVQLSTIILYESKEWEDFCRPNPWKEASSGRQVKVIPIILFSDDVSGNASKKWNKFDVWAMLLAGLPRAVNSHLENIHFLGASNKVDWLEMAKPIVEDLLMLEQKGILAYDACMKEDVLVIAPVICALADNSRASEITGHIGSSGKLYCRICEVGAFKCEILHK